MRSAPKTIRVPVPILDAVQALRAPGQPLADYPSDNAALVGLLRYAVAFPVRHRLTAGIARLPQVEQDLIDDYLFHCAQTGERLAEQLPKPAAVAAGLRQRLRQTPVIAAIIKRNRLLSERFSCRYSSTLYKNTAERPALTNRPAASSTSTQNYTDNDRFETAV